MSRTIGGDNSMDIKINEIAGTVERIEVAVKKLLKDKETQ